jgi:hypothetical protein
MSDKTARHLPTSENVRLLSDHLYYEVHMVFYLAALLARTRQPVPDQFVLNAQIEAFTIHVRQLIDFLWGHRSNPKDSDAYAADFFASGEWSKLRPERPEILNEALRRKVGWGVAHLTYGRARSSHQDKLWDFIGLARGLAPAIVCFAGNVDPTKLEPVHLAGIKPWAEPFL